MFILTTAAESDFVIFGLAEANSKAINQKNTII